MPAQPKISSSILDFSSAKKNAAKSLIDVTLTSTDLHVRRTMKATMDKLGTLPVALETQFTIEIVLAELLNNIVEHAYSDTNNGVIHLNIFLTNGFIEIALHDRGFPMPGLVAPNPPSPNLDLERDDLPEGQFGWYMIRQLCASLDYQRVGEENRICVKIKN